MPSGWDDRKRRSAKAVKGTSDCRQQSVQQDVHRAMQITKQQHTVHTALIATADHHCAPLGARPKLLYDQPEGALRPLRSKQRFLASFLPSGVQLQGGHLNEPFPYNIAAQTGKTAPGSEQQSLPQLTGLAHSDGLFASTHVVPRVVRGNFEDPRRAEL